MFSDIAITQANLGDLDAAKAMFSKAIDAAIDDADISLIAKAQAQAGLIRNALATAQLIDEEGNDPRYFIKAMVVYNHAKEGRIDAAVQSSRELNLDRTAWVLADIAKAQAKAGRLKDARVTFERAVEITLQLQFMKSWTLGYIAVAQVDAGFESDAVRTFASAQEIIRRTEDNLSKVRDLRYVAEFQAEAGMKQESRETLVQALDLALAIADDYEKASALNEVGTAQVKLGMEDDARTTLANARDIAQGVTGERDPFVFYSIAWNQAKLGLLEDALITAQAIEDDSRKTSAIAEIYLARAVSLAEGGMVREALGAAEEIEDVYSSAKAIRDIAQVVLESTE